MTAPSPIPTLLGALGSASSGSGARVGMRCGHLAGRGGVGARLCFSYVEPQQAVRLAELWLPDGQELLERHFASDKCRLKALGSRWWWRGWGLGFDELREVNPALVMVRTSGFGQTGPYSSRPGFRTIAEAMTGFASMHRGSTDGTPSPSRFPRAWPTV